MNKEELRCDDCYLFGLKRNKRRLTSEYICSRWDLITEHQPIGNCSFFMSLSSAFDMYEALKSRSIEGYKETVLALSKVEGK